MIAAQTQTSIWKQVTFVTKDRIKIFGDMYLSSKGKKAPLIILFHQGGGNARGEYGTYIAARLLRQDYNIIAIDQRNGANRFDNINRTAANLKGKEFGFCDAYQDLEAALLYAKKNGFTGKRFAWGSSYSAALVFRLAAEYPEDLTGILAFSPAGGEPMSACKADQFVP